MRIRPSYVFWGLVILAAVWLLSDPSYAFRSAFAPSFPEGFRNVDCKGVTCPEGEFCQENVCRPIAPAITNSYF